MDKVYVFKTSQVSLMQDGFDGKVIVSKTPMDESKYDKAETGPMFDLVLEDGRETGAFANEIYVQGSIDEKYYGRSFKPIVASCPIHGAETTFATTAHVMQEWEVDAEGNFIAVTDDSMETTSKPDQGNTWTCMQCGREAHFVQA